MLGLKKKHLYTGFAALTLSFVMTEICPRTWRLQEMAAYAHTKATVFNFVTNLDGVHEWFPLFNRVFALDQKPLGVGKRFRVESNLALMTYSQDLEVTEYVKGSKLVLESNALFRPVISIDVIAGAKGRSELTLSVYYNRKSALFQYTLGPVLKFLTTQHVRHSLFVLNWLLPPQEPVASDYHRS